VVDLADVDGEAALGATPVRHAIAPGPVKRIA
jgi:hypothetical protein